MKVKEVNADLPSFEVIFGFQAPQGVYTPNFIEIDRKTKIWARRFNIRRFVVEVRDVTSNLPSFEVIYGFRALLVVYIPNFIEISLKTKILARRFNIRRLRRLNFEK